MTRFFGRHIAPEMLSLLVLELLLTFGLSFALLAPGGAAAARETTAGHAAAIAVTVGFIAFLLGLYRAQLFIRTRALLLNTALGGILAFPAVWAVTWLLGMRLNGLAQSGGMRPLSFLVLWVLWLVGLFAVRLGFMAAVRSRLFVRRVVVLGPVEEIGTLVGAIQAGRAGFFEVALTDDAGVEPLALRRLGIRHALTSIRHYLEMPAELRDGYAECGIDLAPEPVFWERHMRRIDIDHLTPEWFHGLDENPSGRFQGFVNRAGDIAISLGFLLFTLPLMGLVALLVRLESAGPVLYRQERVGLHGVPFVVLKFRSMKANAEARGPAWAQARDPRVTRIGSIMRRTRIDELPQLVNVLRGEMSFIGPRPERPHFVEQLADVIPFYRERARVKPGLTGWAQVNYPYGASVEDAKAKLSYDLFYVRNRSVLLDLAILFATVRVILFQEGSR